MGQPGQVPEQPAEQQTVEIRGWYQGTSNITKLAAVYSVKRRKFVKGFYRGSRTHGEILYRLLPGTYIFFEYFGWWRNDPPRELTVTLFRIERDEEGFRRRTIALRTIRFYRPEFLSSLGIPQLVDFFEARPHYHSFPSLNFDRVYTEEDNERLLKFISEGKEVVEGEENE
jgi:hypothetical protein